MGGGHVEGQKHGELAPLPDGAGDFNAAVMVFHDAAGKRETKASAGALGGVERPENVRQILRGDATAGVSDSHTGVALSGADLDTDCARSFHGLHCVEEQIQKHLVDLIAIVLDFWQIGRLPEFDLDWS